MFTKQVTISVLEGGIQLSSQFSISGGAKASISEAVLVADNPKAVVCPLDVSALKMLMLMADQDVVVETNSASSPANVFTLTAGKAFLWVEGMGALRDTAGTAVTVDITTLHVNLAANANFFVEALLDPTP
jgi:hypothetical protein